MFYVKNENTVRLYKIPLLFLFRSADSWHVPVWLHAGAKDREELTATETVRWWGLQKHWMAWTRAESMLDMVHQVCDPGMREAEAAAVCVQTAWTTQWAPGKPSLLEEDSCLKQTTKLWKQKTTPFLQYTFGPPHPAQTKMVLGIQLFCHLNIVMMTSVNDRRLL